MAWELSAATDYILMNTLDNEDFVDADETRKTALLNVADRTLRNKFAEYAIPDEAVYLFAATLAAAYNDTNKLGQQGVASFSISGISFTFKDWAKKGLDALITQEVLDLISEANDGAALSLRSPKWTVI